MLPIEINGHVVGIILKELVRRAMNAIRNERFSFEATAKEGYSGDMDDVFTTADTNAQRIFEKSIRETLPGVGIIGEEGLNVPCTIPGTDIYVTIDPLDGTKAFVRRQSNGVGTMVALVQDGRVASAWIGDVNTLEIYGYRPGSDNVHRISQLETSQKLNEIDRNVAIEQSYVWLRSYPKESNVLVRNTINRFKKVHIDGSSIGTWFTRLWTGEYAAAILDPGSETPWDSTPYIGICQMLGFVFLRPYGNRWLVYPPELPKQVIPRDHSMLVVHKSLVHNFT